MFLKIIFNYIIGYIRICVEGYYIERFINICTNKHMTIWNLKREKGTKLYLNLGINDFRKISKIAKTTKCKVKIQKKKGFPFILNKYKKRKIFAFLLIVLLILIALSSNYIWNIEIREENNIELENLQEDLKNAGLTVGTLKNRVNTKEIINNIRLNRTDIAWMGIELKGTNAIVKVVKADEEPDILNKDDYCDIVSDKNGIITKINAQNGTAQVKVGDTVKEGTTLISRMDGRKIHRNKICT